MKQKKLRSLSAVLLIGWCLIFLRCETTEKSMVRALYLAQKEQSITVGLLYQAPEAAADASEASGAVQLQLAQATHWQKRWRRRKSNCRKKRITACAIIC